MSTAPHCKLCGDRHWSYEGHKYPKDLEVRPMIGRLLGKVVEGRGRVIEPETTAVAVARKPRTQTPEPRTKPRTEAVVPPITAHKCQECGEVVPEPKRGPAKRFCSNKCRMRASRKGDGE